MKRLKIVQISDFHFGESMQNLTALAMAQEQINCLKPDALIMNGDLTNDGYMSQYEEALNYLKGFRQKPLVVVGNHDARNSGEKIFEKLFGELPRTVRISKDILWVGLDSTIPDLDGGRMGRFQYRWLSRQLEANRGKFMIVTLHHHLVPTPSKGREEALMYDAGDALETMTANGVNLALCAHGHVPYAWLIEGLVISYSGTTGSSKLPLETKHSYNLIEREESGGITITQCEIESGKKRILARYSPESIRFKRMKNVQFHA